MAYNATSRPRRLDCIRLLKNTYTLYPASAVTINMRKKKGVYIQRS